MNGAGTGLTRPAPGTAHRACGCSSMAERGPSRHETGVRFPPIRSSFRHSSQRTSATRCAPQAPHRIDATASRTRASSPCRATRAATGTSPEWPQPHRIRRLPPRRLPSRRPSRRNAMFSREAAPGWPAPAGRSSRDLSRAGFAACLADRREARNPPDAILRDERIRPDRPGNFVIRIPSSKPCPSIVPTVTGRRQPKSLAVHLSKGRPPCQGSCAFPLPASSPLAGNPGFGTLCPETGGRLPDRRRTGAATQRRSCQARAPGSAGCQPRMSAAMLSDTRTAESRTDSCDRCAYLAVVSTFA